MPWLKVLFDGSTVTGALMILSVVGALGLALGSLRVKGIGLGIAGVLFSGLLAGHLGFKIDQGVLSFVREFGLVLFVYSIGMQVGTGFFSSFRKEGLRLNMLAAGVVVLGTLTAAGTSMAFNVRPEVAVGLLSGATTNTPSLASAQQTLLQYQAPPSTQPSLETQPAPAPETDAHGAPSGSVTAKLPTLGYAVAYPFGIIGIIVAMYLLKAAFRINLKDERLAQSTADDASGSKLSRMSVKVVNPNIVGVRIKDIPVLDAQEIVVSRILSGGSVRVAHPDDKVHADDILLLVGTDYLLEKARLVIGTVSEQNLTDMPAGISVRRLIVTRKDVVGRTVHEVNLSTTHGVRITRVIRSEVELPASDSLTLNYGDSLQVVGTADGMEQLAQTVGNSQNQLRHSELVPIFIGLALGVIAGSYPIWLPGLPAPIKLGLAGGPLLVALILGQVKRIGPLIWYMPLSAHYILRELGIVLFLASVGLNSGDLFWHTLSQGDGLKWVLLGAVITLLPLLVVGAIGRLFMKMNYIPLCGLLAGSMTDPPALAFAGTITGSEAPSIAYAAVYPLTMTLRILLAQVFILVMVH
jgi:putative transport protein